MQNLLSEQDQNLRRPLTNFVLMLGLITVVSTAVLATHWPALSAKALSFDDPQYLTNNQLVQNPSWASVKRFLTEVLEPSTVEGYYQPLAMVSLMADYALGGRTDNLRQFHRTSLALHTANTSLVVVLLYLLFGRAWLAAGVGLLFGLHPMTVETITWVGERKTTLAAFFALWCLIIYLRFTRRPSSKIYTGSLLMYVLALMSKPTSLPVPLLLLLLDYWPLNRLSRRTLYEKIPFFAFAILFGLITYISQNRTAGTVLPSQYGAQRIPLVLCHNITFYLYKIAWPANLSSHYAMPKPLGLANPPVLIGVTGTCILIVLLVISLRRTPAALTGWLFFFLAILPTMQIIGFSDVIASDKFAYLPSLGLMMILVSFFAWLCQAGNTFRPVMGSVAVATIVLVSVCAEAVATRRYLAKWQNSETLYRHMLKTTPDAWPLNYSLGVVLSSQDRTDEAISHFRKALESKPNLAEAHNNLGALLTAQGRLDEAISHYQTALKVKPNLADAHYNLAAALYSQGKSVEAIEHYQQALSITPSSEIHNNLALVLRSRGMLDEAVRHLRQALQFKPDDAEVHYNLAITLAAQGELQEAISHLYQALSFTPDLAEAHCDLASILFLQNRPNDAISHYRQALQIKPDFIEAHYKLALALTDQPAEALQHFREVARLSPDSPAPFFWMARILATYPDPNVHDPNEAIKLAERAAELTNYQNPEVLETLAASYAAAGQLDQAVAIAQSALKLTSADGTDELADDIRRRLELYLQAFPPTEPPK